MNKTKKERKKVFAGERKKYYFLVEIRNHCLKTKRERTSFFIG